MKLFETIEKPIRKAISGLTEKLEKFVPGKPKDFYSHVVVGALLTTLAVLFELVMFLFGKGIAVYQGTGLWLGFFFSGVVVQVLLMFYESLQSMVKNHISKEALKDIKNYAIGVGVTTLIFTLMAFIIQLML